METALQTAAKRLEKALVERKPLYNLLPAEVELIIYLITILLSMIEGCIGRSNNENVMESRAYRFLTKHRPILDWWFDKDRRIYEAARAKWVEIGGEWYVRHDVAEIVVANSKNIDREFFHKLWVEVRERNEKEKAKLI